MIHKLLKRPQAIIGLCLIAIVIVIAIAAPAFSPHDPELVNFSQKYAQPDAEYPLGTDQLGRCTDVYKRQMIHRPVLCWYSSVGRAADL